MTKETDLFRVTVQSTTLAAALAPYMGGASLTGVVPESDPEKADLVLDDLPGGLRLGSVIDFIALHAAKDRQRLPDPLPVSGGELHDQGRRFISCTGGAPVLLTSKERALITALYHAPDRTISRADLLRIIWGYVPDVETHTLETHIYRLRQKIEADGAAPATLVTTEGGYGWKSKEIYSHLNN